MLSRTRAIVLRFAPYKDNAGILSLYTRDFGRVNLIIYGVGAKKKMLTRATLSPMNIIEVDAHFNRTDTMQRVNTQSVTLVHDMSGQGIARNAQLIFIAETLYRLFRHPLADPHLFGLLEGRIRGMETLDADWHVRLLIDMMPFVGITPQLDGKAAMLNMHTGEMNIYTSQSVEHFTAEETIVLQKLTDGEPVAINRTQRQTLLRKLCRYYEIHIDGFVTPLSLDVLQQVFD